MERVHVYLDAQSVGTMVCPQCGTQRVINVRQQCPQVLACVGVKRVTITCRCGAVVQVQLDLRRHPRKAVQLRGTLGALESYTKLSDMVITSVSVHGVGFVLAHPLCVQIGERYTARFRLDDAEQSRIREPMVIRRLQGATVGAEFIPAEQYHHALDFYVYGAHLLPPPRHVPRRVRRLPGPSPHPSTQRSSPLPAPMVA